VKTHLDVKAHSDLSSIKEAAKQAALVALLRGIYVARGTS
jgi:hypothetical protein